MLSCMPNWKPSCFIIDDALQELKALQWLPTLCEICILMIIGNYVNPSHVYVTCILNQRINFVFIVYACIGPFGPWTMSLFALLLAYF
jgi:hypothetical protein